MTMESVYHSWEWPALLVGGLTLVLLAEFAVRHYVPPSYRPLGRGVLLLAVAAFGIFLIVYVVEWERPLSHSVGYVIAWALPLALVLWMVIAIFYNVVVLHRTEPPVRRRWTRPLTYTALGLLLLSWALSQVAMHTRR